MPRRTRPMSPVRCRMRPGDGQAPVTDNAPTSQSRKPSEPWRQRLIRSLLYGRNVDRAAKARARVGFAIIAFAAIYAVIGGAAGDVCRSVGDSHGARRTASQDAIATARPDIVDRNGEVLATDVKAPSLFGEPRRIIDKDEAIELLTATLPDLDTGEVRDRLSRQERLRLAEARNHADSSSRKFIASAFPASASCARTSASIRPAPKSRI